MRRRIALAAVLTALGLGVVLLLAGRRAGPGAPEAPAIAAPAPAPAPDPEPAPQPLTPLPLVPAGTDAPSAVPLAEYPLDLERLRARLPDNLYWELSVPTSDPAVAERRADRARRLNDLYGKVLSGTGTEEEVRLYFQERRREHEHAMEFAAAALEDAGDALPDRDRGLLELAVKMHAQRLTELPTRLEEALSRREEQDRRRAAWRASQASPPP